MPDTHAWIIEEMKKILPKAELDNLMQKIEQYDKLEKEAGKCEQRVAEIITELSK